MKNQRLDNVNYPHLLHQTQKNYLLNFCIFYLFLFNNVAFADLIFDDGFEFKSRLNDTGTLWAAQYPTGFVLNCFDSTIPSPQDCHQGRDANTSTNSNLDGHAGFSFTKLDIIGNDLAANAANWICVKDNVTGLTWEVKNETTSDIHNTSNTYRWGGLTAIGLNHVNSEGTYYNDWDDLVQISNNNSFCGSNNWRIPTLGELSDLANHNAINPAIDADYFPFTQASSYWSSSPYSKISSSDAAWVVNYSDGRDTKLLRNTNNHVRLVHN